MATNKPVPENGANSDVTLENLKVPGPSGNTAQEALTPNETPLVTTSFPIHPVTSKNTDTVEPVTRSNLNTEAETTNPQPLSLAQEKSLLRKVASIAIGTPLRFLGRLTYRAAILPTAKLLWNKKFGVPRFLWNAFPSPMLDLALNNAGNIKKNKAAQLVIGIGNGAMKLWESVAARSLWKVLKAAKVLIKGSVFLCMEGALPGTPLKVARHLKSPGARFLTRTAYLGTYAAGLGLGGAWLLSGGGLAVTAGLIGSTPTSIATLATAFSSLGFIACSAAAVANRASMFLTTQGAWERPGLGGLKGWIASKLDGAYRTERETSAAFRYRELKDSKTRKVIGHELSGAPLATRDCVNSRLEFLHGTPGVAGLVDYAISLGKDQQRAWGPDKMVTSADILTIAETTFRQVEKGHAPPPVYYPNGKLTIAGYNEIRDALIEINPPGFALTKRGKSRRQYLDKLIQIVGDDLRSALGPKHLQMPLSEENKQQLRNKLWPISSRTAHSTPEGCVAVRTLEKKDFRPSLSEFLIYGGRMIGGVAQMPGAVAVLAGHLLQATGKVFLSPAEMEESINLEDFRDIKAQLDCAMAEAQTGAEALKEMTRLGHLFLSKGEEVAKPFGAALGRATIDAIIMNGGYVALNEMDEIDRNTETQFRRKEPNEVATSENVPLGAEETDRYLQIVESFFQERGDEILPGNVAEQEKDQRWFHFARAAILNPFRFSKAMANAATEVSGGDETAQDLLRGMRIYFEVKWGGAVQTAFRYGKERLESLESKIEEDAAHS